MVIGVPVKLLNESLGFIVTIELINGHIYRGKLLQVEDNMNLQVKEVTMTGRDGSIHSLDQVFLRGSSIRFVIVPDNFKHAPFFESFVAQATGTATGITGLGRGAAAGDGRRMGAAGGRGGRGGMRGGRGGFVSRGRGGPVLRR